MVRQTAVVIIMEILGGLILLALVLAGLFLLRLSSGPIDLSAFRDDVETALTETRQGRPVTIGALQLEWSRASRRVEITVQDVRLMDAAGQPVAEAASARLLLTGSALIFGDIEILAVDLEGGWMALDQMSENQWALAGDPLPPFPQGLALPSSPQGWIDYTGEVLPVWLRALREAGSDVTTERAGFDRFELRISDTAGNLIAKVSDAAGQIEASNRGLSLSLSGSGSGAGLPGAIRLRMETDQEGRRMQAELALDDWPLGELAARLGVAPERSEGLVSAIALAAEMTEAGGLEQVTLRAASKAGLIVIAGVPLAVRDLDIGLVYDQAADRMELRLSTRGAGPFSGSASLMVSEALRGTALRPFELTSPALTLNLVPVFEGPLEFASVRITGAGDIDALALSDMTAGFVSGGAQFRVTGELAHLTERTAGQPPALASLVFSADGPIPAETVFRYWPVKLGEGARRFGAENIRGGTVDEIAGRLTLARDSLTQGRLRDEHLELTFRAEDTRVSFLEDLPPVTGAFGRGRLTGNTFRVVLERGLFSGWTLDEGLVHFPAFWPRGEPMRVFARGSGPAEGLMTALVNSRLAIDLDPTRLSGAGEMTFEMFRPPLNDVPYEDVRFTALGTVRDAGLRGAALGFDLTGSRLAVAVDQAGAEITGEGQLGPSPVGFRWYQGFMNDGAPADLTANGTVTADFLNRFGVLGRAYMTGEAPIDVRAQLAGADLISSQVKADLTSARLDMSELGWVKPAGDSASAEVDYRAMGERSTSSVNFRSSTARVDGDFTLGSDSRLLAATLREAYLRNMADVSGSISRERDESLTVTLAGKYLDISGVIPGLGAMGDETDEDGVPLSIAASVDRLNLRPGLDLRNAKLIAASDSIGFHTLQASGLTAGGAAMEARFDASSEGPPRLNVVSDDAGFIASAVLGTDFLTGGRLVLSGTLEKGGEPANIDLTITDARIREAPFLTQILSLASLRGLTDTLGGEGVMFSRIDIPLKVYDGRYVITGAKAQGPALGLTASGFINARTADIEVDGVLVPSFGINSALGGIPIIGDLVVGRDGEGVFSLTYSVRGTLERANVAVNPLSALAPGVIRRIFENPSDTRIPEAVARPPDAPIPDELPPIPEETF